VPEPEDVLAFFGAWQAPPSRPILIAVIPAFNTSAPVTVPLRRQHGSALLHARHAKDAPRTVPTRAFVATVGDARGPPDHAGAIIAGSRTIRQGTRRRVSQGRASLGGGYDGLKGGLLLEPEEGDRDRDGHQQKDRRRPQRTSPCRLGCTRVPIPVVTARHGIPFRPRPRGKRGRTFGAR